MKSLWTNTEGPKRRDLTKTLQTRKQTVKEQRSDYGVRRGGREGRDSILPNSKTSHAN